MKTRTRRPIEEQEDFTLYDGEETFDLEALSEEDLESLLFEEEETSSKGIVNLPTIAGLSLILVGVAYIFQEMGLTIPFDVTALASMLPWLAGILIILLGFGVLSWRPKSKKKVKVKKRVAPKTGKKTVVVEPKKTTPPGTKKRLTKSREKKISGVCGGIAEYFNLDPTLVRIAFVIGTIASQGGFLLAYLILSFVMPKPEPITFEDRITIIRDS
jgi:phage shock protein C